jgi:hypothetical protein
MTNVAILRGSQAIATSRSNAQILAPVAASSFPIGTPLNATYNPAIVGVGAPFYGDPSPCVGLAAAAGTPGQPCQLITAGILTLTYGQFAALLDPNTNPDGQPHVGTTYYLSQGSPFTPTGPAAGKLSPYDFYLANPVLNSQSIQVGTLVGAVDQVYTNDDLVSFVVNIQNQTPTYASTQYAYGLFEGSALALQAVYASPSESLLSVVEFALAQANAEDTANVAGLAVSATAAGAGNSIVTSGILVATAAQWNAVTGGSSGLTPGTQYYLSTATPGMLTDEAPGSDYDTPVGIALGPTVMLVRPGLPVETDS